MKKIKWFLYLGLVLFLILLLVTNISTHHEYYYIDNNLIIKNRKPFYIFYNVKNGIQTKFDKNYYFHFDTSHILYTKDRPTIIGGLKLNVYITQNNSVIDTLSPYERDTSKLKLVVQSTIFEKKSYGYLDLITNVNGVKSYKFKDTQTVYCTGLYIGKLWGLMSDQSDKESELLKRKIEKIKDSLNNLNLLYKQKI